MSKRAYMVSAGDELRRSRRDLGLTQAQVAEAIGVSASSINSWENGTGGVMSAYSHDLLHRFFKEAQAQRQLEAAGDVKSPVKMRATGVAER